MKPLAFLAILGLAISAANAHRRHLEDSSRQSTVQDPVAKKLEAMLKLISLKPTGKACLRSLKILKLVAQAFTDAKARDHLKEMAKNDPVAANLVKIKTVAEAKKALEEALAKAEEFQMTYLIEFDLLAEQVVQHIQKEQTETQKEVLGAETAIRDLLKKAQEKQAAKPPTPPKVVVQKNNSPPKDKPSPGPNKKILPKDVVPAVSVAAEKVKTLEASKVEQIQKAQKEPSKDVEPVPVSSPVQEIQKAVEEVPTKKVEPQAPPKVEDVAPEVPAKIEKKPVPQVIDPITEMDLKEDERNAKNEIKVLESQETKGQDGSLKKEFSFEHGGMMMSDSMTDLGNSLTKILGRRRLTDSLKKTAAHDFNKLDHFSVKDMFKNNNFAKQMESLKKVSAGGLSKMLKQSVKGKEKEEEVEEEDVHVTTVAASFDGASSDNDQVVIENDKQVHKVSEHQSQEHRNIEKSVQKAPRNSQDDSDEDEADDGAGNKIEVSEVQDDDSGVMAKFEEEA